MDRCFLLHDTTLGILRGRFCMLGNDVYAFNQHTHFLWKYFQYLAGLFSVFIITGNNYYVVAFFNIKLRFESVAHFILAFS